MEEIRPRSQELGALRARVTTRRARAQRWDHMLEALTPTSPRPGVLQLARRRRRGSLLPRIQMNLNIPIPRKLVEFVLALGLVALIGLVVVPRTLPGARRAEPPAAQASAPPESQAVLVPQTSGTGEPVSIMLLGSDQRPSDGSFRTDVMMLVTISPKQGKISVLSFPRDLVGKVPGYGDSRINVVMGSGGFESLQATFDQSYGARPQYYFMINFDAFVALVNSMGGIQVQAAEYLSDSCDLPQSRGGICTVEPGPYEMDGAMALWYVRSRHSSSDFDRLRRAQEVLAAIFTRFMQASAPLRLAEFYLQYGDYVETNMDLPKMVQLLPVAAQVFGDQERIQRFTIPHEITADWIMPDGAHVQLPDYEAVKRIVQEAGFAE